MLSFEQKLQILESFPELQRKNVSLGRVNFHYEESQTDKKTIALHMHPNGNGFIYVGLLEGYDADEKGFVNIREYTSEELTSLVIAAIDSLSNDKVELYVQSGKVSNQEAAQYEAEMWMNREEEMLSLTRDDDLWYIYTGPTIEMVFGTLQEAKEYLWEEGFRPSKE
ncbi:hypothetical protein [Paenibacillus sp. CMAA1364]